MKLSERSSRLRDLFYVAVTAMCALGCQGESTPVNVVYQDPETSETSKDNSGSETAGEESDDDSVDEIPEAEIVIGFYDSENNFHFIDSGGDINVYIGTQGGIWVTPTIRTTGLGKNSEVTCTLVTVSGDSLANVTTSPSFLKVNNAALETRNFPISITTPINFSGIDDLFGLSATLACKVTDDAEFEANISLAVVLVDEV